MQRHVCMTQEGAAGAIEEWDASSKTETNIKRDRQSAREARQMEEAVPGKRSGKTAAAGESEKRQRGFRLGNVVFLSFPIYNPGVIIVPPS